MLKICALCGKGQMAGRSVVRKGLAKKKGGTGKKVTRTTARSFLPNLQKMRILINNRPERAYVCTKCIKKGRVRKA
ncbi:MAG: 50S ribosomal protein L28 [Candidatus Omnitrophica bacterium]|nr:50S ribosomal protein L28 [Candidatus Omnitrophota bacterium]MDD5592344.1 50S ribosomal protein L28 [Candidatus Omnitrophota bacterium]